MELIYGPIGCYRISYDELVEELRKGARVNLERRVSGSEETVLLAC